MPLESYIEGMKIQGRLALFSLCSCAISLSAFCQATGRGVMSDICGVRTPKHNVVDNSFDGQTCTE